MNSLEQTVQEALAGQKAALESVVSAIQDMIYNLALRMLWHPEDAKDATQEILIKVITNLAKFEQKSQFKTWVFRLASNEIINYKVKHQKHKLTFSDFEQQLAVGIDRKLGHTHPSAEQNLLIQEAKIGCSHAMLQCLDKSHRMTYIIGEILEFNSHEASYILDITPSSFRKRMSRIRVMIRSFVRANCGLVDKSNNCRCDKKVDYNIKQGIINPKNLLFANDSEYSLINDIEKITDEVALFQTNRQYQMDEQFLDEVKRIITESNC